MADKYNAKRLIRFVVSGGSAAVTEYLSFIVIFDAIHLALVPSNIISFSAGFIVSFLLNKHWVFKNKSDTLRQLMNYFGLALINLAVGTAIIWTLVNAVNLSPLLAKLLVMVMIAAWNYVIFSKIIFHSRQKNNDSTI